MSGLDSKFDDIEMIQLPDDEDEQVSNDMSISSETEGISDSQESSKSNNSNDQSSPLGIFKADNGYADLSEWLDSTDSLHFKFDKDQYKRSIDIVDSFDQSYIDYVNSMYKTIERLTSDDITRLDLEEDDSPIGLITNETGYRASQAYKFKKADESFQEIIENLQVLINSAPEDKHESIESKTYNIHCIFYNVLKQITSILI